MASAFLIDCSGSTRGWINDVERENLVLMCEAMQRSGDRYAVYAFTGHTRRDCRLLGEKTFEEP